MKNGKMLGIWPRVSDTLYFRKKFGLFVSEKQQGPKFYC